MQIELSKEQIQANLQLLDVAVKAVGLQAAAPALELAVLMQQALEADAKAKKAE